MKITGRCLVILFASITWMQSYSQQSKGPAQLADQYFAAGEYYTAAHLYGQYLNPPRKQKTISEFPLNAKGRRSMGSNPTLSRTDIIFKQAESYRLANYWPEAAAAYKECLANDSVKYADALYWYGVTERSLGNYASAREYFNKFLVTSGANSPYKAAAEKELQTLQYIRQQLARPDSVLVTMRKLQGPNSSERGLFAPVHIAGNQFLISSTVADTTQVEGVNPYRSRLFYATLNNGSIEAMTPLPISVSNPQDNQGAAAISADGKYLYFSQWRKENGHIVSSIYYSVKQGESWGTPVLLPSINSNGFSSKQPFCSKDGKYMFFASDRPGGSGNFDIWYAPLRSDGTTGTAVNAGSMINTGADEQAPFYHNSSSTLVFSSNGHTGMGGYDLFAAKGSEAAWNSPANLGHPVNSSRDDLYFFAPEGAALLSNAVFSSDRGEGCCLETYSLSKAPKSRQLSGILRDCKSNSPLANASVIMKDASGKTWRGTTAADGRYVFDLGSAPYGELSFSLSKDGYIDTSHSARIENIDESDMLTDKLSASDLCMEEKLVIRAEDVVTVYFDFDKSDLRPEAVAKLDSIYQVMLEHPVATIQISGYTDGRGSEEYNRVLSDKRARACADYLLQKGIETGRITFVSFGACCPVEMELINGRDNPDGRSRNRRALINVKKD